MELIDIGVAFIIGFLLVYILCVVIRSARAKDSKALSPHHSGDAPDKDKIVKTLFEAAIHQKSVVRWPLLMAFSIVYSILVVRLFSLVSEDVIKFIMLIPITFLLLYGIFNSLQAHGGDRELVEATSMYDAYKKAQKPSTKIEIPLSSGDS